MTLPPRIEIVSDTGPLISVEKVPGVERLLRQMYSRVLISPAVLAELASDLFPTGNQYLAARRLEDWVQVAEPKAVLGTVGRLDPGEREALSLAYERNLPLLIEERLGRTIARDLGLDYSGTAGQLVRATRSGVSTPGEAIGLLRQLRVAGRIDNITFGRLSAALHGAA